MDIGESNMGEQALQADAPSFTPWPLGQEEDSLHFSLHPLDDHLRAGPTSRRGARSLSE